ncbi:restriction endonuclease subunit S [Pseudomonas lundensis]|uniref:restriction endonuclease subunit S n=1 Tax=Pseudomonas lundensis TaxID=86185 RepID=UPI001642AA3E|nr:restriction endonuclease subunit S [Pseudomonas lundensis]
MNWRMMPLGEVSTLQRGFDLPIQNRLEGEIPIYAANGPVGFHNEMRVAGPGVITGRSGSIGKVHYVEGGYWPLNTSLYVKDFQGNDPKYIYWLLRNLHLDRFHHGTGVPTLNRNVVHRELVPVPPLSEQRRIAEILDKADALRTKRLEAITKLDELLQSVFLEMFGDPVTNPKGWSVSKLGEFAEFENGDRSSNYPSKGDIVSGGVLFLSTKNITDHRLDLRNTQFITEKKFESLSRGKIRKGDLVITLRGTLGACCIFDGVYDIAFINAQMMIMRPRLGINSVFLHSVITSSAIQEKIKSSFTGAAVPQLTSGGIAELGLYRPPTDLQIRFSEIALMIQAHRRELCRSSSLVDDLFHSLQRKGFLGAV